jgi:ferric-dicitrate binding protein FerR (iron transport regulator)
MTTDEEDITARLLRLAGPRPEAPPDRAARVRRVVHQEWRQQTGRRTFRRRVLTGVVVLGTAAAILMVVRVRTPRTGVSVEALASIEQVVDRTGLSGRLIPGSAVQQGQWVETAGAQAALRLTNGTSMRLDSGARVRLLSPAIIELSRGAVYLDTGPNATGLEVRTPLGVAHDIGTQFEVRVTDSALRVRVRTGLVEVRRGSMVLPARPGTEVTLVSGEVLTRPFAAFGPEWDWAARLAPVLETEGRPLSAFLEHVCREQGWTLRYADGQLAREASGIILHGSLRGLDATDAVAAALRTSGLSYRLERGELLVMRPTNQQ